MRRSEAILLVALASAACTRTVQIKAAPAQGAASIIWVDMRGSELVGVWAYDQDREDVPLPIETGDLLIQLSYVETLGELRLSTGPIAPASGRYPRALPIPFRTYAGVLGDMDATLGTVEGVPPELIAFRYDGVGPKECIEHQGCFKDGVVDLAGKKICDSDCRVPMQPLMPQAVDPLEIECVDPWTMKTITGTIAVCAPPTGPCENGGTTLPLGDCLSFDRDNRCPLPGEYTTEGETNVLYVRESAPAGGNGTRASPFRTIEEGLAAPFTPGMRRVLALAAGRYDTPRAIAGDTLILGACPADTEISGAAPIRASSGKLSVEHVTVRTSSIAFRTDRDAELTIVDVDIDHPGASAVLAQDTTTINSVRVQSSGAAAIRLFSRPDRVVSYQLLKVLIEAPLEEAVISQGSDEARIDIQNSIFSGAANTRDALVAAGHKTITLRGTVISGFNRAMVLLDAKLSTFDRLAVANTSSTSIVIGPTSEVTFTGLLIEDTGGGFAALSAEGKTTVMNAAIVRPNTRAVLVDNAIFSATNLWIIEPRQLVAVETLHESMVMLAGVRITGAARNGIAFRDRTTATMSDVEITSAVHDPEMMDVAMLYTGGIDVRLAAQRVAILDAPRNAISSLRKSTVTIDDLWIRRCGDRAIELKDDSNFTLRRVVIDRSFSDDIATSELTTLHLSDLRITGTVDAPFHGVENMYFASGGDIEITSFVLEDDKPDGVKIAAPNVRLSLGTIGPKMDAIVLKVGEEEDLIDIFDQVRVESGDVVIDPE